MECHKPHSAPCFQEAEVSERKDKSICKLLDPGCVELEHGPNPKQLLRWYFILSVPGFNTMLGRNQSFSLTETEITDTRGLNETLWTQVLQGTKTLP